MEIKKKFEKNIFTEVIEDKSKTNQKDKQENNINQINNNDKKEDQKEKNNDKKDIEKKKEFRLRQLIEIERRKRNGEIDKDKYKPLITKEEYEKVEQKFKKLAENKYEISGDMNIDDLLELIDKDDKYIDSDSKSVGEVFY